MGRQPGAAHQSLCSVAWEEAALRWLSDPTRLYGYNPTHVVVDELAQWTTPNLQRSGARSGP